MNKLYEQLDKEGVLKNTPSIPTDNITDVDFEELTECDLDEVMDYEDIDENLDYAVGDQVKFIGYDGGQMVRTGEYYYITSIDKDDNIALDYDGEGNIWWVDSVDIEY